MHHRGEAAGLVGVGVRIVVHHGHDGCRQAEGEDPGHDAGEAGLALGPHHAGLERQADGVVALHRDGQDGQHGGVRHRQLDERDQVAHHLV